jgi:DNA-binding HxlR family transcriptional regulator
VDGGDPARLGRGRAAPRGARAGPPGWWALAGDLLADGPLCTKELDELTPGLGRSALRRRLRNGVSTGLLESRQRGRVPIYELTAAARDLSSVALLAASWERRWLP